MAGILLMLCADAAFAIMAAATKFTGARVPASEVVFVRAVLGSLVLLGLLAKSRIPLRAREPGLLWARGIVGYVALQSYFWAIPQITLGTAVMLNYTAPIFAVVLSFFFLGEKPSLPAKLSLLVSFIGVYLFSAPEMAGKPTALLAGLLSGVLAGSVHVMIRQSNRTDEPLLIVFYFTLCCALGSGLLLLKTGWVAPTTPEWLGLLLIAASSLAGQMFLTYSLQKAPVWVVSPVGYLTPVLGILLGYFLWNEKPTPPGLAGCALVIGCGTALVFFRRRDARSLRDRISPDL